MISFLREQLKRLVQLGALKLDGDRSLASNSVSKAQVVQGSDSVAEPAKEPINTPVQSLQVYKISKGYFDVTLDGLPKGIASSDQDRIFSEIIGHHLSQIDQSQVIQPNTIIGNGHFYIIQDQNRVKVSYELKVLRFLTAMQVYGEARDWLRNQQQEGQLDSTVVSITEDFLREQAQKELARVRSQGRQNEQQLEYQELNDQIKELGNSNPQTIDTKLED
jgi:MFS superfamily sulfate permease-like transporter